MAHCNAMHPNTAKKINAKWLEPVKLATYVMTNGGKNPKPPSMDTISLKISVTNTCTNTYC